MDRRMKEGRNGLEFNRTFYPSISQGRNYGNPEETLVGRSESTDRSSHRTYSVNSHNSYYGPVVNQAENVNFGAIYGTLSQQSDHSNGLEHSASRVLNHLANHISPGAINDSEERCDAPKCMPETRVAVQDEILSWITDGHRDASPKKILWVTGPAGTGKTAILGTIADRYKEKGLLAASFFFSSFFGSRDRRSKKCLISTLAYQLLQHSSMQAAGVHAVTLQSIERDPAIFQKRLQTQLDGLILDGLRSTEHARKDDVSPPYPMAIIIDGLDECDLVDDTEYKRTSRSKEDDHREILSILLHAANDPVFPFKIIVASRPERAIREFFDTTAKAQTRVLFLDDNYNPDADIRLFYESRFLDICRRFNLPASWPGKAAIDVLVENASGQFVYAATTMRFVEGTTFAAAEPQSWQGLDTPDQRLKRILQWSNVTRSNGPSLNPFGALDALYTAIIETCPNRMLSVRWIRAINVLIVSPERKGTQVAPHWLIRLVLELSPGEEHHALGTLASLLTVKSGLKHPCKPASVPYYTYSFYHKSFLDFIEDSDRCGTLYISEEEVNDFISRRFFQTMANHTEKGKVEEPILYHSLAMSQGTLLSFSSKEAFKIAEPDMLSCDVQKWASFTTTRIGQKLTRVTPICERMLCAVHERCSRYTCRASCKHFKEFMKAPSSRRGGST